MGYTILLQWTVPNPPGSLGNLVLTRLLEHYNLNQPHRSNVQIKTYKGPTSTPNAGPSGTQASEDQRKPSRTLSVFTYTQSVPAMRDVPPATTTKDDTAYLFMEDTAPVAGPSTQAPLMTQNGTQDSSSHATGQANEGSSATGGVGEDAANGLDTDGFEVIAPPKDTSDPSSTSNGSNTNGPGETSIASDLEKRQKRTRSRYKIMALRPASTVMPMLQNLMCPFVMGYTKASRSNANTSSDQPRPVPLAGHSLTLTSVYFPPLQPPLPSLCITIHNLPSPTASTIYLEAEYIGAPYSATNETILKEFLDGCIPGIGVPNQKKVYTWSDVSGALALESSMNQQNGNSTVENGDVEKKDNEYDEADTSGWEGIEKMRKVTMMLARCLRDSGMI